MKIFGFSSAEKKVLNEIAAIAANDVKYEDPDLAIELNKLNGCNTVCRIPEPVSDALVMVIEVIDDPEDHELNTLLALLKA